MTRRLLLPLLLALLLPSALSAATADRDPASRPGGRHYILEADHSYDAAERSLLTAAGVEIQRPLGGDRYLVRMRSAAAFSQAANLGSLKSYDGTRKIARSAWTEAARLRSFARLTVLFHEDVAFEDAQDAIATAGGSLQTPLTMGFKTLRRIEALVPASALQSLAADERVFGIFGPPRRPRALNSVAASLSKVTPLFSAPYGLDGSGVVMSLFELANADTTHPQFGGRYITHFTSGSTADKLHSTHVAGTIIASGIDSSVSNTTAARAKGMSPAATLHEFDVLVDFGVLVETKQTKLAPLGSVADNNSWDYALGWQPSGGTWVWNGGEDYLGGYSLTESSPYDAVTVSPGVPLFVHSAGNDGSNGHPSLSGPWFAHQHVDDKGDAITSEIFCYSQNGSGTDCPASTCSVGTSTKTPSKDPFCEKTQHPTYGPYNTAGLMSSTKNSVSVGAVDASGVLGTFSSRGPARDGRVKPELVAKGVFQQSTGPGGGYPTLSGTSMSAPVVTGISGLVVQQYRKTFAGRTPNGAMLKTLLIAGADDQVGPSTIDFPGPDYGYGFGLVDAKATVDLVLADNGIGSRIRTGTLSQGQQTEFPLVLSAAQKIRVVLGWFDPEIYPAPDDPAQPTLLNDLDVRIIDPAGNTVLPYVLDPTQPGLAATRGVNTRDTTEEVEILNAAAGVYRVIVIATKIRDTKKTTQDFVLVANAPLTAAAPVCSDSFEPNDTAQTATAVSSGTALTAGFCQDGDVDFYKFTSATGSFAQVVVTATTTPVKATLFYNGNAGAIKTISAGTSGQVSIGFPFDQFGPPKSIAILLKVEPAGTIVAPASYSLSFYNGGRRHATGR